MDEIIKAPDISTPYAYAKLTNKYSLLQQQILLKVSKHLQRYIQEYFGSDRAKSKEIPKPLLSKGEKVEGVGQIRVSYAELGVAPNNFGMARKLAEEVLSMRIPGPIEIDEKGMPKEQKIYNLFTDVKVKREEGAEASAVTFNLNMEIVDKAFDMSLGYVTHPENIALIADTEKMPLLYYLLKHETRNWKQNVIRLTVFDIKDFLGMVERDSNGQITNISYKKFSQFKQRVMEPTLKDLQRLRDQGLIDMSFEVEYIYAGKRQVGDPAYIQFTQINQNSVQPDVPSSARLSTYGAQEPKTEEKPDFTEQYQKDRNEKIWGSILLHTQGEIKSYLEKFGILGYNSKNFLLLVAPTNESVDKFEEYAKTHMDEYKAWFKLSSKHFGVSLKGLQYKVEENN